MLNLFFDQNLDPEKNLLPLDGTVNYYGRVLEPELADEFYNSLLHNIDWKNDEAVIFGKKIITKRKVAWYGDEGFEYTYSKSTKTALPWTDDLLELKKLQNRKPAKHIIPVCSTFITVAKRVWPITATTKRTLRKTARLPH